VVVPLQDTRQAGDVIIAIAAGLGGSVGRSLPWKSYSDALAKSLPAGSLADMKEKGGRWDEPKTDLPARLSRKFEICSQAIAARMAGAADSAKAARAWPCQGLPAWEPPRFSGDPLRFPLHLVPYRPVQFVENGGRFLSWLSELPLVSAILGCCARRSILPMLRGSVWPRVTRCWFNLRLARAQPSRR